MAGSGKAYWSRVRECIAVNVNGRANSTSVNNLVFGTITVPEPDGVDWKELNRRFASLSVTMKRMGWHFVRAVDRSESGRLHIHPLIDVGKDVRTGFDFRELPLIRSRGNKRRYRSVSANQNLRYCWKVFRKVCLSHGFGWNGLEPIRHPERIGNYVAKYFAKEFKSGKWHGRRWSMSKGWGRWANTKCSMLERERGDVEFGTTSMFGIASVRALLRALYRAYCKRTSESSAWSMMRACYKVARMEAKEIYERGKYGHGEQARWFGMSVETYHSLQSQLAEMYPEGERIEVPLGYRPGPLLESATILYGCGPPGVVVASG